MTFGGGRNQGGDRISISNEASNFVLANTGVQQFIGSNRFTPVLQVIAGPIKSGSSAKLIGLNECVHEAERTFMHLPDFRKKVVDLLCVAEDNRGLARDRFQVFKHLLKTQNKLRDGLIDSEAEIAQLTEKKSGSGRARKSVAIVEKII